METESEKVRDPVCGMWVNPEQLAVTFVGMRFAFCSEQCRERFLANPRLYIGKPGEPAPKQSGQRYSSAAVSIWSNRCRRRRRNRWRSSCAP